MRAALLSLLLAAPAFADGIPDSMRACAKDSDCVVLTTCGAPEAVNVAHREAARKHLPDEACLTVIAKDKPSCERGRCSLPQFALGGAAAAPRDPTGHHFDAPPESYARSWDDPRRDRWQQPAHVLQLMGLQPGMTVVDIGAGTGYFERHLDRAVGDGGKVIAVDVEPKLVAYIEARARREGWKRTRASLAPRDDPRLEPGSVDRVLIVDTWHHIDGREAYAQKLAAALRPDGRVVIVEVTPDSPHGPKKEHRLAPAQVIAELTAAGLEAQVVREKLSRQYVVVGRKPAAR